MYFNLVEFGRRVRELRIMKGMKQEDLANEMGVSYVHLTIQKSRVSIRLIAPYSDARRKAASEYAKKNSLIGKIQQGELAKTQDS